MNLCADNTENATDCKHKNNFESYKTAIIHKIENGEKLLPGSCESVDRGHEKQIA